MYRILVVADLHCGSHVGLRFDPVNEIQEILKQKHEEICEWCPNPDLLIANGDMNDGLDPKGRDLQVDDIPWQIEEAEKFLLLPEPKKIRMTHGSSYHTGDTVAYERFLCGHIYRRGIDCDIKPVQKIRINDWWVGFFRHKTSRSVIPHGRHTGPARGRMWGAIKAARKRKLEAIGALPRLWCYSHVHYYSESADLLARTITTPGFKAEGPQDKFGQKNFEDSIDIGAVQILIGDTEEEGWEVRHLAWPADLVDDVENL